MISAPATLWASVSVQNAADAALAGVVVDVDLAVAVVLVLTGGLRRRVRHRKKTVQHDPIVVYKYFSVFIFFLCLRRNRHSGTLVSMGRHKAQKPKGTVVSFRLDEEEATACDIACDEASKDLPTGVKLSRNDWARIAFLEWGKQRQPESAKKGRGR